VSVTNLYSSETLRKNIVVQNRVWSLNNTKKFPSETSYHLRPTKAFFGIINLTPTSMTTKAFFFLITNSEN